MYLALLAKCRLYKDATNYNPRSMASFLNLERQLMMDPP
jgi:hypothetical protein